MFLCETVLLRHRVAPRSTELHRENGLSTGSLEMRPISSTLGFFSVVPCAASLFLCETVLLRHRVALRFTELHRENGFSTGYLEFNRRWNVPKYVPFDHRDFQCVVNYKARDHRTTEYGKRLPPRQRDESWKTDVCYDGAEKHFRHNSGNNSLAWHRRPKPAAFPRGHDRESGKVEEC